jgi:hypothetical protein
LVVAGRCGRARSPLVQRGLARSPGQAVRVEPRGERGHAVEVGSATGDRILYGGAQQRLAFEEGAQVLPIQGRDAIGNEIEQVLTGVCKQRHELKAAHLRAALDGVDNATRL